MILSKKVIFWREIEKVEKVKQATFYRYTTIQKPTTMYNIVLAPQDTVILTSFSKTNLNLLFSNICKNTLIEFSVGFLVAYSTLHYIVLTAWHFLLSLGYRQKIPRTKNPKPSKKIPLFRTFTPEQKSG